MADKIDNMIHSLTKDDWLLIGLVIGIVLGFFVGYYVAHTLIV